MKVLVLAQYFPPDMGGGSTRASNVVNGLLKKGCDVKVVAAFPHYPYGQVSTQYRGKAMVAEQFGVAKVYRVWIPSMAHSGPLKRIFLHLCFVLSSLFALPFVGKVDVVWGANPNLFSILNSIVYSTAKRVPIVRNVDDLWPEVFYEMGLVKSSILRKMLNLLAWFSYNVPKAITPISEGYKSSIVAKYGLSSNKLHVIEVGVDGSINPEAETVPSKQFVVMYSGALGLGYDFDVVLKAAKLLAEKKEIVFVVRGAGEMVPLLRRNIRESGLGNIVLKTSLLPKAELKQLLLSADVFVLPMADLSFVELGLPTKVFEYQSLGKPIICVSSGELAHYVETTKSGIVVKPSDARELADAVIKLHRDNALREELGLNGKDYVLKNMTSQQIGLQMYAVLDSVIQV
jgi:glycosyltransferase involved in cell wall biosynthesis